MAASSEGDGALKEEQEAETLEDNSDERLNLDEVVEDKKYEVGDEEMEIDADELGTSDEEEDNARNLKHKEVDQKEDAREEDAHKANTTDVRDSEGVATAMVQAASAMDEATLQYESSESYTFQLIQYVQVRAYSMCEVYARSVYGGGRSLNGT
jgi:midasin (ATPase involved in ribosome maturation)